MIELAMIIVVVFVVLIDREQRRHIKFLQGRVDYWHEEAMYYLKALPGKDDT